MEKRDNVLLDLKSYTDEIDKEMTMILQSLQWDRQHLLKGNPLVICKYDAGHRIPEQSKKIHEQECFLRRQGYLEEDVLLPDPLDPAASTLVKLSNTDIYNIINIAATSDPHFKRVLKSLHFKGLKCVLALCEIPQPLSLDRLQATFSVDERRAIHNAVVSTAPACHDLSNLTLLSGDEVKSNREPKSRLEILSEMRDMKRRRTKYRVASKTKNYSDVLRDLIVTQMELYTEVKTEPLPVKSDPEMPNPMNIKQEYSHRDDYENGNSYNEVYAKVPHRFTRDEPEIRTEHIRTGIKREPEERHDKYHHRKRKEYSRNKHDHGERRRINEKERNTSPSRKKSRRHNKSDEHHRYEREKSRYEESSSRDRRMEERYGDRRDKHRSSGSHVYSDVKIKEEKRRRHYDYDDSNDKRRH